MAKVEKLIELHKKPALENVMLTTPYSRQVRSTLQKIPASPSLLTCCVADVRVSFPISPSSYLQGVH